MTWRNKALFLGVSVGALAGVGAALLYIRSVEDTGSEKPKQIGTGDALMLVISVFNIIKQAAKLAD